MDEIYVVLSALESDWLAKAIDLVRSGVPFILKGFDHTSQSVGFEQLEGMAEEHGLEASFNLTERMATFEQRR